MENQVRFNSKRSKENPTCMNWYFLIINRDKREIGRIETSIQNLFFPIIEEGKSYSGVYSKSRFYKLINFDSEKKPDSCWRSQIFHRVLKDNDLYRREKDPDGLEKYISELDEKILF